VPNAECQRLGIKYSVTDIALCETTRKFMTHKNLTLTVP